MDTFGVFGPEDRAVKIEHGWLTYESVVRVQLQFLNASLRDSNP